MLKTTDLFVLARIFKKLELKKFFLEMVKANTGKETKQKKEMTEEQLTELQKTKGVELFTEIIDNIDKIESEVYIIVASESDITVEEVQKQDPTKTIETLKSIFKSELFQNFFKSAIQ